MELEFPDSFPKPPSCKVTFRARQEQQDGVAPLPGADTGRGLCDRQGAGIGGGR